MVRLAVTRRDTPREQSIQSSEGGRPSHEPRGRYLSHTRCAIGPGRGRREGRHGSRIKSMQAASSGRAPLQGEGRVRHPSPQHRKTRGSHSTGCGSTERWPCWQPDRAIPQRRRSRGGTARRTRSDAAGRRTRSLPHPPCAATVRRGSPKHLTRQGGRGLSLGFLTQHCAGGAAYLSTMLRDVASPRPSRKAAASTVRTRMREFCSVSVGP